MWRLDDIPDGDAVALEDGKRRLIAVRRGGDVFVYLNNCPHRYWPLDYKPGQFLNAEKTHILCANHGALFDIETGACVSGACGGKGLRPVAVTVKDGEITLAD